MGNKGIKRSAGIGLPVAGINFAVLKRIEDTVSSEISNCPEGPVACRLVQNGVFIRQTWGIIPGEAIRFNVECDKGSRQCLDRVEALVASIEALYGL